MQKITSVIFDVGNVLIPWEARWLFKNFFENAQEMEKFIIETDFVGWNMRQDAGYPFSKGITEQDKQHPQYAGIYQKYYDNFFVSLGEPILETVELIYKLKTHGIKVFALTNFSEDLFNKTKALPKYKFLDVFEGIVVSGVEKLIKPDPAIYKLICERYKLIPSMSLFIDDNFDNVKASQNYGLQAIQFINPHQLFEETSKIFPALK